jgi:hypothetical protein
MTLSSRCIAATLSLALAGCGLFQREEPPPEPPEPPACPVVEPTTCPEPKVVEKEKVVIREVPAPLPPMASTAGKLHLPIIGAVEWARVDPSGLVMEARIDTGAETSSIHAEEIQLIERDGKRYVSFVLLDPATGEKVVLERRLRRRVRIKQQDEELDRRFVVQLWVTLGNHHAHIEVNLSDREDFEYPLLIGRNFLTDSMIVDVSRHHTLGQPGAPQ